MMRRARLMCIAATLTTLAWAGQAAADVQVSTQGGTPNLGAVVNGSGTTSYSIASTGVVTRTAGSGFRISSAAVTVPTVTLRCGVLNLSALCAVRYVRVTVQPVAMSGPATITQLRVSGLSGASYFTAPVAGSTVTFVLNPVNLGAVSFKVSMDVAVTATAATGNQTFDYVVTAELL